MRRVASSDTQPEQMLRKALWRHGLRYRICHDQLPGKPDIVLVSRRLVIFVDGDFWHGGQYLRRGFGSLEEQFAHSSKREYWVRKIGRNVRRDLATTLQLLESGWRVIRFWESDLRRELDTCVQIVLSCLAADRKSQGTGHFPRANAAEFFAGIGLMRLALEQTGWRVDLANDIDPKKYEMYGQNFAGNDEFLLGDIHKLTAAQIPTVTLATASFPCNDLSLAGKRKGLAGEHSGAFWGLADLLEEMADRKPRILLIENVPGFLSSRKGLDLADAMRRLNSLGYACDLFTVNAAAFVPQSRQRLFIVGSIHDSPLSGADLEPVALDSATRPRQVVRFIKAFPDIQWRIRPLPKPPSSSPPLDDVVEDLADDANEWWNDERAAYLLSQMSERHRAIADEMIAADEYSHGTVFRRVRKGRSMAELRVDGIAGCLRTPRGGSGRQILFRGGRGTYSVRLLTPRECARLQGVDDDYRIDVPTNQALFGFGDAVCVPVVEWILTNYIQPLVHEMIRGVPLDPILPLFPAEDSP